MLSGFELYSRWVPLNSNRAKKGYQKRPSNLVPRLLSPREIWVRKTFDADFVSFSACRSALLRYFSKGLFIWSWGTPDEVTCGGSPHLSCKRDQIKMIDYMGRRVTPPKGITSPTWGPSPPCKQALRFEKETNWKRCNKFLARQLCMGYS